MVEPFHVLNLIKEIAKFGLGADVVSLGELMKALKEIGRAHV